MVRREQRTENGPAEKNGPSEHPNPIYNWLSIVGCVLLVGCLTTIVFFFFVDLVASGRSGYGVVTFFPSLGLAAFSMLMVGIGYVREVWRQKRGRHSSFLREWVVAPSSVIRGAGPVLVASGVVAGTLVVLGGGAASLTFVEFTESNEFCGQVCHEVMRPESTAYPHSTHSRIACVECHVGRGADSYLRAKLDGLRQVQAVATGEVRRPIPTPIHNRRPSSEMCGSCHQVDRFVDYKTITRSYFLSGEENEFAKLRMMLKVGGVPDSLVAGSGIHYHMLIARKVEYIARDAQHQDIAWVRVTHPDGRVEEYEREGQPLSDAERESLEVRTMECVDCHSRPAHRFPSPVESVNAALVAGSISARIPEIKEAGVRALDGGYETTPEAMNAIGVRLRSFYEEKHPELLNGNSQDLGASIAALQDIYRRTIFPEMKADWTSHPNNIGHWNSPGCFRCHNDELVNEEGQAIFKDCTRCHAILTQGDDRIELDRDFEQGVAFLHPEDRETVAEFTFCPDCHTGGADLYD